MSKIMEGWDETRLASVEKVLDVLQDINYEIHMCQRGCSTRVTTYLALQEHLIQKANELIEVAEEMETDEPDENEEES